MSSKPGTIVKRAQERYLERLLPPVDALLAEMERRARESDVPIADPQLGRFLEVVAATLAPGSRILEVGTGIGYGTLRLARAAPAAAVVTLEHDPARAEEARSWLTRGGVATRVEILVGEAQAILPDLAPTFDLVFLDADKVNLRRQLDLTLPLASMGARYVVDNLLWSGAIAEPGRRADGDASAEAIEKFNPYFLIHPQLRAVLLPLGDGVGFATKIRPTIREQGGPF